jgi:hypothetical protein
VKTDLISFKRHDEANRRFAVLCERAYRNMQNDNYVSTSAFDLFIQDCVEAVIRQNDLSYMPYLQ